MKPDKIEFLRERLYHSADRKKGLLCSKEVYKISKRLDAIIAKYMHSQLKHII
ncbi:MAG: aspartyl-phosphate phosphatase Spo0E family protein [Desulfocucumaceae bacterium]